MLLDAGLSMIFHTVVTALFHLLGAAISHRQGLVPESTQLVPVFSRMYTETLGGWAENAFLIGALVVLFVDSSRRTGSMAESVLRRVWPLWLN